jgi:fibronectin-binding autotransporter adhesin
MNTRPFPPGFTRRHVAIAALATMISVPAVHAITDTWNLDAAGSWGVSANWLGGTIPNGVDDVANFTNNISAARTITLDGTRTVGTLKIGDIDSNAAFTLTAVPSGGAIVFDVTSGPALLEFSNGAAIVNTLTAPIVLKDDLRIAITGSSTGAHVINGPITGAQAVTIDANGTHGSGVASTVGIITFNGFNTFSGGLTVSEVRLQAANAFALGSGTVTVNDGGQIYLTAATATYNNHFVLNTVGWNETGQGQFGALRSDQNTILNGNITLAASSRVGGTGTSTVLVNGVISETGGARDFEINRLNSVGAATTSQWVFNNTNTYTGKTTIYAGTLRVGNGGTTGSLGSTSQVEVANGTLEFRRSDNVTITTPFVQLTGPINGAAVTGGSLVQSGTGTVTLNNGTSAVTGATTANGFNGRLVLGTGGAYNFPGAGTVAASNGADIEFNTSSNIDIGAGAKPAAQTLTGAAGSYLIQSGTGTTTLGGTADNAGGRAVVNAGTLVLAKTSTAAIHALGGGGDLGLIIAGGTVRLGGSGGDQIVDTTAVRITNGTLDLNGMNEAFDVLTGAGGIITNGGATASTLTVGSGNSVAAISEGVPFAATYGGVVQNGISAISLTKVGTGTQTLSGANTYTGATNINAGTLAINGSLASTGTVVVNTSGVLAGAGSVGNVTMTLGSNLRPGASGTDLSTGTLTLNSLSVLGGDFRMNLGGAVNDRIAVTGTATFTSASTVTPTFTSPPTLGTVKLLTSGGLTVNALPTLAGIPAVTRSTFSLSNTANDLELNVAGAAAESLTWSGTVNGNWDLGATSNFGGGAFSFFNLDAVTFGDGAANRVITLAAGLVPSSVTVANSTGNDYTFQTGSLTGATGVTKGGNGLLILNTANTFSGDVRITGGTLRTSNATALGDIVGQTFISNGGTLDINAQNLGAERVSLAGAGVGGNGAIVNSGGGQNNAFRFLTLTGDATIGGTGRYDIRTNGGGEIFDLGGFTLTKMGTNQFSIVGIPVVTDGNFVVNGGIFSIETTSVVRGTGTITYNAGTTAQFFQSVATNITRPMVWNGNFVDPAGQTNGVGSNVTMTGDATLQGTGTLNFTGNIAENGGARSIVKNNTSTFNLQGNVNYTGTTTVNAGILTIGNGLATTLPATSAISLAGGGLLNFFAAANMNIPFPVNIATSGGTLRWSGGTQASTLTISNTVGSVATAGALSVAQGTVTLANGAIVTVANVDVGRTSQNTNNIGTLNIEAGAQITIGNTFFIGESATGLTGIVNQTGGSVTVNGTETNNDGSMRIGHWSGLGSAYNISAGTLSVLNATTSIGIDGVQPSLNISGGTVSLKRLLVDGRNNTGPIGGFLRLSGGTLAIGDGGIGTIGGAVINISGGTLQALPLVPLAASTWSAGMNFETNTPTIDTNGVDVFLSGAASGGGGFTKIGAGTLVMSNAANNLNGTINANGGTTIISGNLTGTAAVNVNSGANVVLTGRQSDTASIAVNAGGTLAVAGDGIATGRIGVATVSVGGTIRPGSTVGDGSIGTLTAASMIFAGNASFDLTPGIFTAGLGLNDLISVTGGLTLNGGVITPLWIGAPTAGTYTLFTSSALTVNTAPTLSSSVTNSRQTYSLQQNVNNYELVVAGTAFNLTWSGGLAANAWDVNTTANWKQVAANDQKFFSADSVTFDDTGSTTPNVNLVGTVLPGSTVVNAAANYTFTGSGIGSGSLTKAGTGTLTLANNNTYPGLTTISGGTLQIGNGGTIGSISTGPVQNDASLAVNRSDAVTLANVISGTGALLIRGGATVTTTSSNTYSGGTVISSGTLLITNPTGAGTGTVTLGDADTGATNVAFLTTNNIDPANNILVTANGTGTATIGTVTGGTANSIFTGTLVLNRPTILQGMDFDRTTFLGQITGNVGTLNITGGRRITLESTANDFVGDITVTGVNTILQASTGGAAETIPNASSITMSAGTIFQLASSAGGTETINGLNGTGTVTNVVAGFHGLTFGSAGGDGNFTGTVNNGGVNSNALVALTKIGAGTQTITGAVNSTGSITISGGVFNFGNVFGAGAAKAALTTDTTLDNTLSLTGAAPNVTTDLVVGMSVTGTGVPAGSRITSIPSANAVTIAGLQTATLAGNLTFGAAPMFLTSGGTFRYSGGARTDDRFFMIDTNAGAIEASGTGALTLSAPLQFTNTGARIVTLGGTSTLANVFSGIIADNSGATTILKAGTGTWVLSGVNTYTGGTSITGGVLRLGSNNRAAGDGFAITINGGTLDVNGANGATATRRYDVTVSGTGVTGQAAIWNSGAAAVNNPIYRSVTLAGDTTIGGVNRYDLNGGTIDGAGVTFNGGIFTLTKVGNNELWWSPNAGATVGSIVINAGTFGVQSSNNLGDNSLPIIINTGGTLYTFSNVNNSKDVVLNGGIFGANNATGTWNGSVTLNGAGTSNRFGPLNATQVTLTGRVTGSGGFEKIQPGTVEFQNPNNDYTGDTRISAGTLRVAFGGSVSPATTLDMNGGTFDLNNPTQTIAGLKGATGIVNSVGSTVLTVDQAVDTVYGGTLQGVVQLIKTGAGTLALTATSGTLGGANVDGGTLLVNGSLSNGPIGVSANGTLGGSGTVGLTTLTGGTLAPGATVGKLTTGTLSFDAPSRLTMELANPTDLLGVQNDLVSVQGDLTLDGTLSISPLAGFIEATYRLIDYTGVLTNNGLTIDPAFLAVYPGSFVNTTIPQQVNLVVIPEPSSVLMLTVGALALGLRRRRARS